MINAAGNQILNLFETLGVRYLTLNWSENSSQKLLDSKTCCPLDDDYTLFQEKEWH